MRLWLVTAILLAGVAAAYAISPSQQIIIFGGSGSTASGGGGSCSNSLDFSAACNSQYLTVVH